MKPPMHLDLLLTVSTKLFSVGKIDAHSASLSLTSSMDFDFSGNPPGEGPISHGVLKKFDVVLKSPITDPSSAYHNESLLG